MLLASIADEFGTWFLTQSINVRQYGVGVKDGLAQCIHSLRLCLEAVASQQDPNNPFCALITDMSNTFNELNRDALFQMLLITPNEKGPWMLDLPAGSSCTCQSASSSGSQFSRSNMAKQQRFDTSSTTGPLLT